MRLKRPRSRPRKGTQPRGTPSKTPCSGRRAGTKRKSRGLHGVREAARKDSTLKFTALLHHVNEDCLTEAFFNSEEDGGRRSRRCDMAGI